MTAPAETKTVAVATLGCRSNQYDSSAMVDSLRSAGLTVVPFVLAGLSADAYVINTCTVTGRTDYQGRQLIRRIRRGNPDAVIIVTGCYAEVYPDDVAAVAGVDFVLGNPEKEMVAECVGRGRQGGRPVMVVGGHGKGTPLTLRARTSRSRTRVNLKIQDGCDRGCTYCIIPKARGASKSVRQETVLDEIEALVEKGFREIVITGIHLGAYGDDLAPPTGITALLKEIERRGFPCRFRISSLDPDELTDELIELLAGAAAICNHMHLPLQSGDDRVLALMGRPYRAGFFADRVERLVEKVPGVAVGTDVIAGFPGEGEREFENTCSFIKDLPLAYLHVFPYSPRRGAPASYFRGRVDARTVKGRAARLGLLDRVKRREFYNASIGSEAGVLVESGRDRKTGFLRGRTANYIPVFIDGPDGLKGSEVTARLCGVRDYGMVGRLA